MKTAPAVHNSRHNLAAAQDTDPTFVRQAYCTYEVSSVTTAAMKSDTFLGIALMMIGLSLLGQLSVALMPFQHPVRIIVQLASLVLCSIAGTAIYAHWRHRR